MNGDADEPTLGTLEVKWRRTKVNLCINTKPVCVCVCGLINHLVVVLATAPLEDQLIADQTNTHTRYNVKLASQV